MQCGDRPLRALPARARCSSASDGPVFRCDRGRAAAARCGSCDDAPSPSSRSGSSPPATAASSALLDCEDELLALAGEVEIAYFLEATERDGRRARTTSRSSRARSPRRTTPSASSEVRARVAARWSRSAPAPPPAASRRCATSPTSTTSRRSSTPRPEYISTLATSTPIAAHVQVDFELHGCPIDKRQLLEVISAFLHERRPRDRARTASASSASARGNVCVMVAHGTPCLGPGHPRRLRRALPGLRPRLLRLLRPDGDAQHRPRSARWLAAARDADERDLVRVYRTFNAGRRAVPQRERGA